MKRINKQYNELFKYIIAGILTTIVNVAIFYFFDTILSYHYLFANFISIAIAIIFAFFMNKIFVFGKKSSTTGEVWKEFILFGSFRIISGSVDMVSMGIFVSLLSIDSNIAKLITEFIIASLNYFFSKFIIFKKIKND